MLSITTRLLLPSCCDDTFNTFRILVGISREESLEDVVNLADSWQE